MKVGAIKMCRSLTSCLKVLLDAYLIENEHETDENIKE